MTEIVYSRTRNPRMNSRRKYENPRFFSGVQKAATKVFVEPGYPQIVAAYEAAGAEVEILGAGDPLDHDHDGQAGGDFAAERDGITKAQIIDQLTAAGIEHDPKALKADLLALLPQA